MRKIMTILLLCFLITGCAITEPASSTANPLTQDTTPVTEIHTTTTPETEVTVSKIPLNIHVPDDNAEFFETIPTVIDNLNAEEIIKLLIVHSILEEGILLNSAEIIDAQLNLDFNQAFLDQLLTYGTAGERMMIGCVVNTFLSVYDAETVYITVNGEVMESGHVIYDFPMEYFE